MLPRCPKMLPKCSQNAPKLAQHALKMSSKCIQNGAKLTQDAPKCTKIDSIAHCAGEVSGISQDFLETLPKSSNCFQDVPKKFPKAGASEASGGPC